MTRFACGAAELLRTGPRKVNGVEKGEPDFGGPITNVTVALGREAKLSCVVDNLASYKVGWMRADTQTILSLHNAVVTHNTRISVTHEEPHTWNLHIRQVKESDRGCYMCQINTATMKKNLGCIDVHVPPNIVDEESSGDVTVVDGGSVTLVCSARGYPAPRITWRREDGEQIVLRRGKKDRVKVPIVDGPSLNLTRVNRRQMGAYQCIANNDVPPAVVKRIVVNVEFAPSISVVSQLVGSPLGEDLELRCDVEAWPPPIVFWRRTDRDNVILDGMKHSVSETRSPLQQYRTSATLVIRQLQEEDYATYTCAARNSLSTAEGQIRTYKIDVHTPAPGASHGDTEHRRGGGLDDGGGSSGGLGRLGHGRMIDGGEGRGNGRQTSDRLNNRPGYSLHPPLEVPRVPPHDPAPGGVAPNHRPEFHFFDDSAASAPDADACTAALPCVLALKYFLPGLPVPFRKLFEIAIIGENSSANQGPEAGVQTFFVEETYEDLADDEYFKGEQFTFRNAKSIAIGVE
ncbi:lachesin-like [Hyalella azteca]|uniref:Lachesin-like n=1 Tax=Hyalella azteca TaxID=294128 RepID=A0A8B7P3N6_HYAAZ|nr:lachesin-like [Hyalella azteca]